MPSANLVTAVGSWGEIGLVSLRGAFAGATNLTDMPFALPTPVSDLTYMFLRASSFDGDIGAWDTSNVTNMAQIFKEADAFHQDLNASCVTKLTARSNLLANDPPLAAANAHHWGNCP